VKKKLEDIKVVIKNRKSMDRQRNVCKNNDKRINNGMQDITYTKKNNDRAT
jgi:hypothetical protein